MRIFVMPVIAGPGKPKKSGNAGTAYAAVYTIPVCE
jgi:hypothetical protein